eukprot:Skav200311  [mRNA]  locus=scaffold4329:205328:206512:- [translate_table: standard]
MCGGAHGVLEATTAAERARAAVRSTLDLPADRLLKKETRNFRKQLIVKFRTWLWVEHKISFFGLMNSRPLDAEKISFWLSKYGQEMYRSGKAYGQFSETINAIGTMRPLLKKQLTPAWDVAFAWLVDEPHQHHPALPVAVLLAMLTTALWWGWPYEAAVISLAWAGLLRIGEVLQACRADLVLPQDATPGYAFALLKIKEAKTRGRAAKHQSARVDQPDLVELLTSVYGHMSSDAPLWPWSAATLRKRFNALLEALSLPTEKRNGLRPFDLASLRPGGATWLLNTTESGELVRRRGRWISTKVMEIYLQEISVATYIVRLEPQVRRNIEVLALGFETTLERVTGFLKHGVPPSTWRRLLKGVAAEGINAKGMGKSATFDDQNGQKTDESIPSKA